MNTTALSLSVGQLHDLKRQLQLAMLQDRTAAVAAYTAAIEQVTSAIAAFQSNDDVRGLVLMNAAAEALDDLP